jgi:hypothetical protein
MKEFAMIAQDSMNNIMKKMIKAYLNKAHKI